MPKKRGRKTEDDTISPIVELEVLSAAPEALQPEARNLWRSIVASRGQGFFSSGDLPLLEEYCHTCATLIPRVNRVLEQPELDPALLRARDTLVRQAAALARSLRICVSSRTRPDTAVMRDSVNGRPHLWS